MRSTINGPGSTRVPALSKKVCRESKSSASLRDEHVIMTGSGSSQVPVIMLGLFWSERRSSRMDVREHLLYGMYPPKGHLTSQNDKVRRGAVVGLFHETCCCETARTASRGEWA